ncbi:MAG: PepSY domain-containing protein, partial [Comamonadaceae bacterium]|nr:PepSY domain-containing protein [Comamonadaceae bacterium]
GEGGQITITHPAGQPLQVRMRRPYGSELPRHETPETEFRFDAATGALLATPVLGPGIRLRFVMLTLHDGWFARPMLLWLYVLSGLLGCFMIATGMVLWVVKRRDRHARRGDAPWGVELVARLNVGMLAGLLLGMAAFFWANRLLPVGLEGRAAWEIHGLFAVWLVAIMYGLLRPEKRAWTEVLSLAALAFGLVPLLNALTTDRHLGVTLPAGDGGLAGFDLSMLALALLLGAAAWRLRRKWFGAAMRRNTP